MFFDALVAATGGCVNLAGSAGISGPASAAGGSTVTVTAVTTGITAGSTPYTYAWSVVSNPSTNNVPINSGQGTASMSYTQVNAARAPYPSSSTVTLTVSNCGTVVLTITKTILRT